MSERATPSPVAQAVTVLLIDDQAIVGESVRRMLEPETDIVFHFCKDPTKAIETANAVRPTVILQDLVMPEIDGLLLVKFFRANEPTRKTPMIVLSSKEEPTVKAQAFARGANDYLVKLPDRIELIARIRYHSQSYIAQLERDEAYRRLAESERLMAEELAQASRYVQSLLPAKLTGEVGIEWLFEPSTQLGGDMFGYHWLDPDHLAVYLLDVSGHGVGSSLLAVSAVNLLGAHSLAGVDFRNPGLVLARLNDVFPMEKQNGKYFTMWYGVYRKTNRTLLFANAAHPPPLLFTGPTKDDASMQLLKTTGLAVGIMEGAEYDTAEIALESYARLLIYSDGVYEIARPDGSMWSASDFAKYAQALAPADGPVLDRVLRHVKELHGSDMLADDFSILEVSY